MVVFDDEDLTPQSQLIDDKKPMVGMEFSSIDDAYDFYNRYAKEVGFSIRRAKSTHRRDTKEIMNKYFFCGKEGTSSVTGTQRLHALHRENCTARVVMLKKRDSVVWTISKFIEQHNHMLASPRRVGYLRSHRNVSEVKKRLTMELSEVNIPIYKQIALYEVQSGGIQNMGCTETDIRNYQRDLRREVEGHDVQLLEEHFRHKKSENSSFYYDFDLDEDNVLDKCFWADAYSRRSYGCYGDVVVFDTTYNTNRYDMKFAPFVGVNKHVQTIVFACAFLSQETTSSFVWVFEQFKNSMPGPDPVMIITDQAAAIANAISTVFPNTLHRLCIWHIQNKFSTKLDATSPNYSYKAFHDCIWNIETREEFDSWWLRVLEKTNTVGNEWLNSIFDLREKWVPAYCNDTFSAGMASSQRVEGAHAFFKNYITRLNTLMEFIIRFDRALSRQRSKELEKNHIDLTTKPLIKSVMPMEGQMADIYTRSIFLKFQVEMQNMLACILKKQREDENEIWYKAIERKDDNHYRERTLFHNKVANVVWCSCRKLQSEGIPCRHLLAYLRMVAQEEYLPDVYILKRWTKAADAEDIIDNSGLAIHDNTDDSLMMHKSKMSKLASELVELSLLSEPAMESTFRVLENQLEAVRKLSASAAKVCNSATGSTSVVEETSIFKDPLPARVKGSGKRFKSPKETSLQSSKRHCTKCGKQGHDKRRCTLVSGDNQRTSLVENPITEHNIQEHPVIIPDNRAPEHVVIQSK